MSEDLNPEEQAYIQYFEQYKIVDNYLKGINKSEIWRIINHSFPNLLENPHLADYHSDFIHFCERNNLQVNLYEHIEEFDINKKKYALDLTSLQNIKPPYYYTFETLKREDI